MSVARRGKPYVEAFPALSLRDVRKTWDRQQRIIEWSNEEGVVVGHVELLAMSDTGFTFRHQFFSTPNVEKSSGIKKIAAFSRNVSTMRVTTEILCP